MVFGNKGDTRFCVASIPKENVEAQAKENGWKGIGDIGAYCSPYTLMRHIPAADAEAAFKMAQELLPNEYFGYVNISKQVFVPNAKTGSPAWDYVVDELFKFDAAATPEKYQQWLKKYKLIDEPKTAAAEKPEQEPESDNSVHSTDLPRNPK